VLRGHGSEKKKKEPFYFCTNDETVDKVIILDIAERGAGSNQACLISVN